MGNSAAAKEHVFWAIWHEGVEIYYTPAEHWLQKDADPLMQVVRPIARLREEIMYKQTHNDTARNLIAGLNDDELMPIIEKAVQEIPSLRLGGDTLPGHFRWVCFHEGWLPEFRQWNADRLYRSIRGKYREMEDHNSDARNLLAAVDNRYIKAMIDNL
ncbi:hypothetical protein [Burkholderia cenocepacia]|uniref:hypothetical protein n=1 Tax=Burkholderia cenocepacia TaxID=95486 RepID=UPI001F4AD6AF|nr:hypothetical protein [Burkholderia cenocepacia]